MNISGFLRHAGVSATLRHITSYSYDEYDEATPSYAESTVYVLLQPSSADERRQLEGGVLQTADAKAYLAGGTAVAEGDVLVVGSETWEVQSVEQWEQYVVARLTKR